MLLSKLIRLIFYQLCSKFIRKENSIVFICLNIYRYVQDLYSSRFTDEESYYWTMFVSGVKFINEMI